MGVNNVWASRQRGVTGFFPLLEREKWRESEREKGRTALPTIVGGSLVQVSNGRVDPSALLFMSNSRVQMLNRSGPSLYLYKNVRNEMLILIDELEAERTIILMKSGLHWCDGVECYWSLKFMLLGGSEKGTQRVVSRGAIIPHLQVFLLPQSLSSLVKRKSICTDVYEEWKIAQRKRKDAFWWKRDSENWRWMTCYWSACGLVCLFAWLAAVSMALPLREQYNEKCVFEFNSLLRFITVFKQEPTITFTDSIKYCLCGRNPKFKHVHRFVSLFFL